MTPYELHEADVMDALTSMPSDSFDGMLTDPPYGLSFMGRDWDSRVPGPHVWAETLRVLKPGAHALVFGGTRTWHRLAVALEDAGFELRDTLMWIYGSGFPKSHDVSKAIDHAAGAERKTIAENPNKRPAHRTGGKGFDSAVGDKPLLSMTVTAPATPEATRWDGYGTALKPAWEPILLVRKPPVGTIAGNALEYGTGALNIDGCRVPTNGESLVRHADSPDYLTSMADGYRRPYMEDPEKLRAWHERKVAKQERATELGRWPANVIHDGSHEATKHFPDARASFGGGVLRGEPGTKSSAYSGGFRADHDGSDHQYYDDGSAARFFYAAKASREEREAGLEQLEWRERSIYSAGITSAVNSDPHGMSGGGMRTRRNSHPTVKPIDLCRYLALLIRPPAREDDPRRILVPFAGSGSEMIGALNAGWDHATGIERENEYVRIADARLKHHTAQPRLLEPA